MGKSANAIPMEKTTHIPQKDNQTISRTVTETEKEVRILITDITLHSNPACNPKPFSRGLDKSIRSGKPGRTYVNDIIRPNKTGDGRTFEFTLPFDKGLKEVFERAKLNGKTVRLFIPKNLPILLGKDAVEKYAALKRQGIM